MVTGEDLAWNAGDIDVVRQVVDAFKDRDVARMRTLFDEQAEFTSTIAAIEGGTYRGRDGIERYVSDVDDVFDDWHSEDERYLDAGSGRVVFTYRVVGRGKGSGAPVDEEIAIVWTIRDEIAASSSIGAPLPLPLPTIPVDERRNTPHVNVALVLVPIVERVVEVVS